MEELKKEFEVLLAKFIEFQSKVEEVPLSTLPKEKK